MSGATKNTQRRCVLISALKCSRGTVFSLNNVLLGALVCLHQDQSKIRRDLVWSNSKTALERERETADTGDGIHSLRSGLVHAVRGHCFLRIEFRFVMETEQKA